MLAAEELDEPLDAVGRDRKLLVLLTLAGDPIVARSWSRKTLQGSQPVRWARIRATSAGASASSRQSVTGRRGAGADLRFTAWLRQFEPKLHSFARRIERPQ
jgi:hypothetical protein